MYSPFHRLELTFHLPELTFQRLEHKTYRANVAQPAPNSASRIGLDFYADTVSPKIKKVYAKFSRMNDFI